MRYMAETPASRFAAYTRNSEGNPATQHVSLRLSNDLVEKLSEVGNAEGLSMSDTIRMVLWRGIRSGEQPTETIAQLTSLVDQLTASINTQGEQ